jgi:hypothetical protein
MKRPKASREHTRTAIARAGHAVREAQESERDEIVAARRALRDAEREHDREVTRAERELGLARAPGVLAAYGHELVLYDDRLRTPGTDHRLTGSVTACLTDDGERLLVKGPDWREEVTGAGSDRDVLRKMAEAIEAAAGRCDKVASERSDLTRQAEERLAAARAQRLAIGEARPLLDRVAAITGEDECVLDMAPGITTGHEGVLVVTDRGILFVGLRLTLRKAYEEIDDVSVRGRFFGSRLIVSARDGRIVVSGVDPRHAAEIAELACGRLGTVHSPA